MATSERQSQSDLIKNGSVRKRRKIRQYLKKRHQVHCATPVPKTDDAFIEDRTKYKEVLTTLPNRPPFLQYARTVRRCFKVDEALSKSSQSEEEDEEEVEEEEESKTESETSDTSQSDPPSRHPTPPPEKKNKKTQVNFHIPEIKKDNKKIQVRPKTEDTGTETEGTGTDPEPPPQTQTMDAETQASRPETTDLATVTDTLDLENKSTITEPPPPPGPPTGDCSKVEEKLDVIVQKITLLNQPPKPQDPTDCIHVITNEVMIAAKIEILQKLETLGTNVISLPTERVEVKPDNPCLCHLNRLERGSYVWYEEPDEKFCPDCCLTKHGLNLLVVSGQDRSTSNQMIPIWLGQMLLCLETDNHTFMRYVLKTMGSDGPEKPWPIYERLVFIGCVWQAYKCIRLLLPLLGVDEVDAEAKLGDLDPDKNGDKSEDKPPGQPKAGDTFNNVYNILNKIHNLINDKDKKRNVRFEDLFEAARSLSEHGLACFQSLLMEDFQGKVLQKRDTDQAIIIHELIELDQKQSMLIGSEARNKRRLISSMLDAIYNPKFFNHWMENGHKQNGDVNPVVAWSARYMLKETKEGTELCDDHKSNLVEIFRTTKEEPSEWKHTKWRAITSGCCGGRCAEGQLSNHNHSRTPLQYAAVEGTPEMLEQIITQPPYKVSYEGNEYYSMDDIDTCPTNKQTGSISVLDLLQRRMTPKENNISILSLEPLRTLVEDKWARYRRVYILWVIACFLYMVVLTACVLTRPVGVSSIGDMYQTSGDFARLAGEVVIIFGLFVIMYSDIMDILNRRYSINPFKRLGLYRLTNILFMLFVILAILVRIFQTVEEDTFLALALLCGWMNMVHRLAAFRPMGAFPVIMHHAIIKDLVPGFIWVYVLFLVAISSATFTAYQTTPVDPDDELGFPQNNSLLTTHSLFSLTFGLLDTGYELKSRVQVIGLVLFYFYLVYGNIILLNILIAMVNNTYTKIAHVVENHWIQIQLGYALLMESWFPFVKIKYREVEIDHGVIVDENVGENSAHQEHIQRYERQSDDRKWWMKVLLGKTRGEYVLIGGKCYVKLPSDRYRNVQVNGEVYIL